MQGQLKTETTKADLQAIIDRAKTQGKAPSPPTSSIQGSPSRIAKDYIPRYEPKLERTTAVGNEAAEGESFCWPTDEDMKRHSEERLRVSQVNLKFNDSLQGI